MHQCNLKENHWFNNWGGHCVKRLKENRSQISRNVIRCCFFQTQCTQFIFSRGKLVRFIELKRSYIISFPRGNVIDHRSGDLSESWGMFYSSINFSQMMRLATERSKITNYYRLFSLEKCLMSLILHLIIMSEQILRSFLRHIGLYA